MVAKSRAGFNGEIAEVGEGERGVSLTAGDEEVDLAELEVLVAGERRDTAADQHLLGIAEEEVRVPGGDFGGFDRIRELLD